jgi:fatty acid desaturase 2 (delta-6 desaturase)
MGRGGEGVGPSGAAAPAAAARKSTLLIDGELYDASNFNHPGGSIIKFLSTGADEAPLDASNAFREFHCRSGKAAKYLQALPKLGRPGAARYESKEAARREALTRDFVALRAELVAEGRFDASWVHVALRVGEVALLFAGSFWLLAQRGSPALVALGVALNGLAQGRCGWLMHEGGHYSMTGRIAFDVRLQELIYGLGCGMSGAWWRNQHNKHHAAPQQLKHDVDLDTLPLVAFNERIVSKVRPGSLLARWLRLQAFVFAPISCLLVGLFWTLYLHPRHVARTGRAFEAACIAARYAGWAALTAAMGYGLADALQLYLLCFGVGCTYIFLNFAVSHTHLPVSEADEFLHWVDYSAKHTTNVSTDSWFVTWWMSYLNFQIEHHLFPSMPQFNHPRIAERVKALFRKHGLVYDERPYLVAMHDTFANLHAVGQAAGKQQPADKLR